MIQEIGIILLRWRSSTSEHVVHYGGGQAIFFFDSVFHSILTDDLEVPHKEIEQYTADQAYRQTNGENT